LSYLNFTRTIPPPCIFERNGERFAVTFIRRREKYNKQNKNPIKRKEIKEIPTHNCAMYRAALYRVPYCLNSPRIS
jgi:hypothetical protein